MRLNVFTPLPPARTEIAQHSAMVLPHLAERAEVVAWCAQGGVGGDVVAIPGVEVRRFDHDAPPWAAIGEADANVFNFGNNLQFHHWVHAVARRVPGVAVLHDTSLHHFFAGLAQWPEGAVEYAAAMRRHHGAEGAAAAAQLLAGQTDAHALSAGFPLSLGVAARALAVVVHNPAEARSLRRATRTPVHLVPLATDAAAIVPPDRAGRDTSKKGGPLRLVVFGHLGQNRRIDTVLAGLAKARSRSRFVLDIYGAAEEPGAIERQVERLRLGDRVVLHGFVPAEVLRQGLDAADLAINLRFPTMGEASASQLRIFAHALPSVVSGIGWYATLPPDAVRFVAPEDDGTELAGVLDAFAARPEPFRAAGLRGREIVLDVHRPGAYAAALLAIAGDAAEQHRRRAAVDLAGRVAEEAVALGGAAWVAAYAKGAAREIGALFGRGA